MENVTLTKINSENYQINGVLDFDTVVALQREAKDMIAKAEKSLSFDFSAVTYSNSAGLALLTTLLRFAKHQKKSLHYLNLPTKLLSAAKISDLDQLINV